MASIRVRNPSPAFKSSIDTCPRCGLSHNEVIFYMFDKPSTWGNCYGFCPDIGAPILAKVSLLVEDSSDSKMPSAYRKQTAKDGDLEED